MMPKDLLKLNLPWITLVIFIFAVSYFFVLRPLISEYRESQTVYADKSNEVATMDEKINLLQIKQKNRDEIDKMSREIDKLYPDSPETSDFIIQIEKLANEKGVIINNLSISESKGSDTKKTKDAKDSQGMTFSFDLSTSYNSLVDILRSLEHFERLTSLDNVNILSHNDDALNIKITGKIFYGK
jgi:Tfp pilus assembly protein PilO